MILEGYGIMLERLKHEEIELVRQMRNSDAVRAYMNYQEIISPDQQEQWFHSINNEFNNYFLIICGGKKCGMISGAQIDWEKMESGNGGMFFWDDSYWGTLYPLATALLLTDISFLLGFQKMYIRVLKENYRAIAFNQRLGYKLLPGQDNEFNQVYVLNEENYIQSTRELKKLLTEKTERNISCVIDDPEHPASRHIIQIYRSLPEAARSQIAFAIVEAKENNTSFPRNEFS